MDGNAIVAHFIHELAWDDIPADVQHKVRMCLLDVLGAALSGTLTRVSQIAARYACHAWQGADSSILLHGAKATAAGAAFANGCAANGFDSDDLGRYTKGHPGAQVFATALALAERDGRAGREMLTAMVVGYEVAHRAGRCWHDDHAIYQACGSWGSMAAAATAAHLMQLAEPEIQHALGIAEYHAPNLPMMRDIDHPAMVKHGIGWGAMTGITAAELAAHGFTGIPSLLGFDKYHGWVADIGIEYLMLDGISFKEFACCSWSHAAIMGARKLRAEVAFVPEDIDHIRVEGYSETLRLGADLPRTTEEAQFNTAWPLASYLADGEVGPRQTLESRLDDERLIDLARKIEIVEFEELTHLADLYLSGDERGVWANRVLIRLKDGRELDSGIVGQAQGDAAAWDDARLEQKFRRLAGLVVPEDTVEQLVEMAWHFEEIENVSSLVDLVAG